MNDLKTKIGRPEQKEESEKISSDLLHKFRNRFREKDKYRIARNAVANSKAKKVGFNRDALRENVMTFSHEIETGEITNQKKSGRCWAFAGLNLLRLDCMKEMNVEDFELSQAYMMFWDKLEKANFFLENVLNTLDEPVDSRLFMWLLRHPMDDGGQWDMFVNLVNKYGIVPKEVYPESKSSSATRVMNAHLKEKLREFASELRQKYDSGQSAADLRKRKEEMLETVYRILSIHNGEPPSTFDWSWRDSDDEFHDAGEITPEEFVEKYVNIDVNNYVSLIHCPSEDKEFNTLYTVSHLGSVWGRRPVLYLNVELDQLKEITTDMVKNREPVWFGCDVGKQLNRTEGILDTETYEFDLLYDTEFQLDKGSRVRYGHSRMTHAMMLTGVHINEGSPERWKVENSWGEDSGKEGFLVMDDEWFDEYLFQVVVPRDRLSTDQQSIFDEEPEVLPPWDPMGSLALMK